MTKINEAYEVLGLEENASVIEIRKAYRKLSLEHHSKNNSSEDSKQKFKELQDAYDILIKSKKEETDYKINFGVSEAEIAGLDQEIIENFVSQDLKEFITKEIQKVKNGIENTELDTEKLMDFFLPEQGQIFKNWLNTIYLMGGLGKNEKEIGDWVKTNLLTPLRVACEKKDFFDLEKMKADEKGYSIAEVSDEEWEDYLAELRIPTIDTRALWKAKIKLFKQKSVEIFTKKLADKSALLIDLINIEANYHTDEKDFSYNSSNDYWKIWLNNESNIANLRIDEFYINKILKEYEKEEALEKAAAIRYYEVLGLPEEASIEEVKVAYRELSLKNHPDKGGDRKKFNIINNANQVLGNEHQKAKYDLCLLKDRNWEDYDDMYLNRKGWVKFSKSKLIIDNDFGKRIELILKQEFEVNDLTEETISDYSKVWEGDDFSDFHHKEEGLVKFDKELAKRALENFKELSEPGKGLLQAEEFYAKKIFRKTQPEAIRDARKYLEIIEFAIEVKERLEKRVEKAIKQGDRFFQDIFNKAELNEEELKNHLGELNNFKSCQKKFKDLELKNQLNIVDQKYKSSADFMREISEKLRDIKKAKDNLLAEIGEEIGKGEKLLAENKNVSEFSIQFNDFMTLLKSTENYEVEIEKDIEDGEEEVDWSDEELDKLMRTKGKVRKITKYKTIKQNVIVNRALINRILEEKAEEISSLQVKLKVQLKEASENTPSWIAFQKWLQKEITDTEDLKVKIRPEKQDRYQISVETLTNFCDSLEATLDKNSKDYHLFPEFDQNKSFAELFPYEKALL
ncbi:DnaJ domain-containing protein, partial [endosymbiont GvMRE of Glomus versiforme]|uniref:DnaJ domain-containing protein n=1 Tax=endosymbiont GvMRE of Glomus versiforme TaxID=2039283 RepID=UPI001558536A